MKSVTDWERCFPLKFPCLSNEKNVKIKSQRKLGIFGGMKKMKYFA